ncbi:hypothetical protein [Cupriavidus sp. D39]|uniref:hypothetical protein n=1 Tax=Cupriavidus sp. D39 TaxID=2997877 RepID=UPI00226F90B2|nr:hypothetical protein [Cupriavidus sp. D39]MCY0855749.1 hypothetical protein [Cupriavidus sp. D39]
MIKNILMRVWYFVVIISTIGGVAGLYQQISSSSDYGLTLFLKSADKIIENKSGVSDIRVYFNDKETTSLYLTKIQLKNTGKRAFTKDYIFEPITIASTTPTKLLRADCSNNLQSFTDASFTLRWNLFNPTEAIDCSVFSTEPLTIRLSNKIKEVAKVEFVDQIANPPAEQRVKTLNIWWLVLIAFSVLVTWDAALLVKADSKCSRVLGLIKSLPETESVNKEVFLDELRKLYEDYYQSAKLFVTPDQLADHVSSQLQPGDAITGRYLQVARDAAIEYVMNANLYNIRAYGIFYGPALFVVSAILVVIHFIS